MRTRYYINRKVDFGCANVDNYFSKYIDKSIYAMLYSSRKNKQEGLTFMTLYEELYFEIQATGTKSEVKKFISYLNSGELEDFFEFSSDYINYDDDFENAGPESEVTVIIANDDYGIEIDEFYTDEFLEVLCKAGKRIFLKGQLYDIDNEEYSFVSEAGNSYYTNALLVQHFNEDDDKPVEDDEDDE